MELITASSVVLILLGVGVVAIAGLFLFGSVFTVDTANRKIVQRLGKFHAVAGPGLNFKIPFVDQVVQIDDTDFIDMRIQQLDLAVETKTKDNTFVKVHLAIQYQITDAEKAHYRLDDPEAQISAYVFDVVRSQVPTMLIDETFEKKNDIADGVKRELSLDMAGFGYEIIGALVTDVDPEPRVKSAMNDIVASQREQVAAMARGEANKILLVKQAEAEAESKKLQGEGIANQRKAIIAGLEASVAAFQSTTGVDSSEVMRLVLLTQYFDTLKDMTANGKSNTVLLPHSPGALGDFFTQLQSTLASTRGQGL